MRIDEMVCPGNIHCGNRTFIPSEIIAGIDQFARYLREVLVSKSPFVYLFASNNIKTILALYGIVKAGRICVVVDPRTGRMELDDMHRDTPPAASVRIDATKIGWHFDREVEVNGSENDIQTSDDIDDVCMMIYTAADDGYAKAAMLTHENVLADAMAIAEGNLVIPGTTSLAALPFSHGFGLQTGLLTPTLNGADVVIADSPDIVNGNTLYSIIQRRRISHFYSVPAVFYILAKSIYRNSGLIHLKSLISGGYALKRSVNEHMVKACGLPIRQGYGLTEASPVCSWVFTGNTASTESIGRPIACCDMKIAAHEAPSLPPEENGSVSGEIMVKGKNVMKGYYHFNAVNSRVLENGWLHTGDIGYRDAHGFFYLQATKKRMINRAGMKVYPAEVERYLKKNDNVAAAMLYGIDDLICGQNVGCILQLKRDTPVLRERVRRWIADELSDFKVPKTIDFVNERSIDDIVTCISETPILTSMPATCAVNV